MKRHLLSKIILLFILMTIPAFAQESWVVVGEYKGIAYSINPMPRDENNFTNGLAKNEYLEGNLKGVTVIHHFQFDCPSVTLRQVSADVFDPKGKLIRHSSEVMDWIKPERGSFAHQAITQFWCTNL